MLNRESYRGPFPVAKIRMPSIGDTMTTTDEYCSTFHKAMFKGEVISVVNPIIVLQAEDEIEMRLHIHWLDGKGRRLGR